MVKSFPKISYKSQVELSIEVMTFTETYEKLEKIKSHNPFTAHKIQFYFILVITKNSYSHYVDFEYYNLKEGNVLFIAKNQVHHFTKNSKKAEGFCIVINGDFLEKNYFISKNINLNRLYNYHLETPVIFLPKGEKDKKEFVSTVKKLHQEYTLPNTFAKSEMLRAYLHIILIKAERVKEKQSVSDVKQHWLEIFNNFRKLLSVDYVKTRSSRFYASELLVSYKFLNDVVKELTGKTAKTFIDDFVIIEIKRYLSSSSLSIKEISYKTGFEEPANMIKFFKKNTSKTPLQFRKEF